MISFLCDFKIVPEKEKKIAQINLVLYDTTWFELNSILASLLALIPNDVILKHSILEQKTCFIEIQYGALENIAKKLEEFIKLNQELKIQKKQIFIKKLGGWFDF